MINRDQLIEIGQINKPHGLKGEMNVTVENDIFDTVDDCPYLICEIDGIFVPFFIDSYRFRSDTTMLLKLDDVNSQEEAKDMSNLTLYFDKRCFSDEEADEHEESGENQESFIGYSVHDTLLGDLGTITDIDDQTVNVLFIVDHKGAELLIPAVEDLIEEIDDDKRIVYMKLPKGLVNLDEAESEND